MATAYSWCQNQSFTRVAIALQAELVVLTSEGVFHSEIQRKILQKMLHTPENNNGRWIYSA